MKELLYQGLLREANPGAPGTFYCFWIKDTQTWLFAFVPTSGGEMPRNPSRIYIEPWTRPLVQGFWKDLGSLLVNGSTPKARRRT